MLVLPLASPASEAHLRAEAFGVVGRRCLLCRFCCALCSAPLLPSAFSLVSPFSPLVSPFSPCPLPPAAPLPCPLAPVLVPVVLRGLSLSVAVAVAVVVAVVGSVSAGGASAWPACVACVCAAVRIMLKTCDAAVRVMLVRPVPFVACALLAAVLVLVLVPMWSMPVVCMYLHVAVPIRAVSMHAVTMADRSIVMQR